MSDPNPTAALAEAPSGEMLCPDARVGTTALPAVSDAIFLRIHSRAAASRTRRSPASREVTDRADYSLSRRLGSSRCPPALPDKARHATAQGSEAVKPGRLCSASTRGMLLPPGLWREPRVPRAPGHDESILRAAGQRLGVLRSRVRGQVACGSRARRARGDGTEGRQRAVPARVVRARSVGDVYGRVLPAPSRDLQDRGRRRPARHDEPPQLGGPGR